MADYRLVVTNVAQGDPDSDRLLALPANPAATGIGLPAFNVGPALPPAGTVAGEGFLDTSTHTGWVWDGNIWQPIVPTALLTYPDDSALLADTTQTAGTYAISAASGNMFIVSATGWRMVGARTYPTVVALLADTPADGSMGVALDADGWFVFHGGTWVPGSVLQANSQTAILTNAGAVWPNVPDGQMATALDTGTSFTKIAGAWQPTTAMFGPEADITANTGDFALVGDGAFAVSDVGRTYIKAGGTWVGAPVRHYPTEADLLADTPADGTLAFADDTGLVYGRSNGGWRRANSPTIEVVQGLPNANTRANGDLVFAKAAGIPGMYIHDGTSWNSVPSVYVSATEPSLKERGVMWMNNADPRRIQVWDGASWRRQPENFVGTAYPGTPITGDTIWNPNNHTQSIRNGANWDNLLSAAGGANGNITIGNVKVQWGKHAVSSDGQVTLNFGSAFSSAPWMVITSNGAGQYYGGATVKDRNSFYYDRSDSASGTVTVYYIAVGPA